MSNGYFLADTNSLVFTYRAGGPELLDAYLDAAKEQNRKFAITETVRDEIRQGPLKAELGQYLAERNIPILSATNTEQRLRAGSLSPKSAGEVSMLEVAARESDAGRITRIWSDDKYFDSEQIMRQHPDAHRTMSAELLDEIYEQKYINAAEHQRFRAGYAAQGAFIDSPRINAFRYDFSSPEPVVPASQLHDTPARINKLGTTAGVALYAATEAYAWNETRQHANVFEQTMHNETAARDAYVQQSTQSTAGIAGLATGSATAAALELGSGGTFLLVAGEGYLFSKAADHGMQWWQNDKIYSQTDQGVQWQFNGGQWVRHDLRADLVDDGRNVLQQQDFSATPDQARRLSYRAGVEAVEQALEKVPEPRNPFSQPANDADRGHLYTGPWTYDAGNGQWSRNFADEVDRNDLPVWSANPEVADPQRAAQLSAQAMQTIDGNLKAGPATIAAQYQAGYQALGYEHVGAQPPSIAAALDPNLLQASDGKHYQRDAQGTWLHNGEVASASRALELELTRDRLLPALEQHRQHLADMPQWQPPTPEQQDRDQLRRAYAGHGLNPNPETLDASYRAVQNTRTEHGLGPQNSSLTLAPDARGQYSLHSPIQHLHRDADGAVRIAATTSAAEIDAARPHHAAPEHRHTQATAEQRDTREQAQREANRQGLSRDDVQQAVMAPTHSMSGSKRDDASRELDPQREGEQRKHAVNGHADPGATTPTPIPPPVRPADPRDPDHPDHRLYTQIAAGVARLDTSIGRTFDAASERLAMGTLADAKAAGITSVDHVVLNHAGAPQQDASQIRANSLLIAIQGQDPSSPAARRSITDIAQASDRSLGQSMQQVEAVTQQRAQQQIAPTQGNAMQDDPGAKALRRS